MKKKIKKWPLKEPHEIVWKVARRFKYILKIPTKKWLRTLGSL